MTETCILKEDWEVLPRLAFLQLEKSKLLTVRDIAIGASADATPFHPANAAGTFAYHHATFALRNEFVGDVWRVDRTNGVEGIRNDNKRIKIAYANVDLVCNDSHNPQPRSLKGAGAERLCADNGLFGPLPSFFPESSVCQDGWQVYYLMVAPNGAVELSRPTVEGGCFKHFIERLYLSDGSDLEIDPARSLHDDDVANDFDPKVERK